MKVCICFRDNNVYGLLVADIRKSWHSHMEGGSKKIAEDIVRILNHQEYDPRNIYEWEDRTGE